MNPPGHGVDAVERKQQMAELAIGYDDGRYEACGYRYERLEDAVNYARQMRERRRPGLEPTVIAAACLDLPPLAPTAAELAVMAKLGIILTRGAFEYRGYRYDRLADAVSYAVQLRLKADHAL